MSTAPVPTQALTPKDLKGWPDNVSTALLNMVNRRGVRARVKDGGHVLLYAPDGEGTLKVSRSRKPEDTMKYLGKFCDEHLPPVVRDDRPARDDELAPLLKLNTRAAREAEAIREAKALAQAAQAHAEATWRPYMGYNGKTPTTFETNGKGVFRCTVEGCGEVLAPGPESRRVLGPHAAVHRRLANEGKAAAGTTLPMSPQVGLMRKASGKTWKVVGASMGLSDAAIRGWIARGAMPEARGKRLADVLGVTLSQLTGSTPWEAPAVIPAPRRGGRRPQAASKPQAVPQAVPEAEVAPMLAQGADAILTRIAALAHQALGEPDLAAELTQVRAERNQARAEAAELRTKLDEANAKLDLMREALAVVDDK